MKNWIAYSKLSWFLILIVIILILGYFVHIAIGRDLTVLESGLVGVVAALFTDKIRLRLRNNN